MCSCKGEGFLEGRVFPTATLELEQNRQDEVLAEQIELLQGFMVEKGLIDPNMSNDDLRRSLNESRMEKSTPAVGKSQKGKDSAKPTGNTRLSQTSESEITIYKRAVEQVALKLNEQIEKFINQTRLEVGDKTLANGRKVSTSSEEMMDTSDELMDFEPSQINTAIIPDRTKAITGATGEMMAGPSPKDPDPSPDECLEQLVKNAENSRAKIYGVKGEAQQINVAMIDQDYQMIDAHIDESLRKKIINFEYVDFSKLLANQRAYHDEEGGQHMEIVNKNGQTFLAPVSDKDRTNISSYLKWEQAFRVFSNVLTTKYPGKVTELLQYNHTIHSAVTTYLWKNVYSYDRQFRYHISRHPYRSWAAILQQAWTMLLKDRVKNENNYFQKGNFNRGLHRDKEPCRHFNKGHCTYGLSCKFDHHCSVKKCGKFGHGAHICRLRGEQDVEKGVKLR